MKGKKVLEFLILKPAFTSRNISSLGLVALFFFVYWLAGGKVAVPSIKQGTNFGSVTQGERAVQNSTSSASGVSAPAVRAQLPNSTLDTDNSEDSSLAEDKTKQLEEKLQKLNELEERLKSLKRAKTGGN